MAMLKKISLRALLLITIMAVFLLYCPSVNSELCSSGMLNCGSYYTFCQAWGQCDSYGCETGEWYVFCWCDVGGYVVWTFRYCAEEQN